MLRDLLVAEFFSLKGWDFSAPGIARGRGDEGLQPEGLRPVVVRILAALQAANPAECRPRALPGAGGCQPFRLRTVRAVEMGSRGGLDDSVGFLVLEFVRSKWDRGADSTIPWASWC